MLMSMKPLLNKAREQRYAVPQPDFINLGMAASYLKTAALHRSPLILGFGESCVEESGTVDLRHLVRVIEALADRYDIPVALHLDHGSSFEACAKAINAGFTSVMIDGSHLSFDDNVRLTRSVVELAKLSDVSVEGEIGRINSGVGYDMAHSDMEVLTDPESARDFVAQTGVDALAVSIGTVHGEYKAEPHIRLDLLERISKAVPVPLVLHGASGTAHDTLNACVRRGVCKVNIYTDISKSIHRAVRNHYTDSTNASISDVVKDAQHAIEGTLGAYMKALESALKV